MGAVSNSIFTSSDTSNFLRLPVPEFYQLNVDGTVGYYYNYFSKFELDSSKQGTDPGSQFIKLKWRIKPFKPFNPTSNYWSSKEASNNPTLAGNSSSLQKSALDNIRNIKDTLTQENINFDVNPDYLRFTLNDEDFYKNLSNRITSSLSLQDSKVLDDDSPINFQQLQSVYLQNSWEEKSLDLSRDFNSAPLLNFEIKKNVFTNLFSLAEFQNLENTFSGSFNEKFLDNQNNQRMNFKFIDIDSIKNENFDENILKYSDSSLEGFLLDKYEVEDGRLKWIDTIILSSPTINSYTDSKITYGKKYSYCIKSIYRVSFVTLDVSDQEDVVKVTGFIASSQSRFFSVECINVDVPPYPSDISFYWNSETNKPRITWTEPVNSRRDIKGFLLLKRPDINSPFNLIKMYDFNDAIPRIPNPAGIPVSEIEILNEPKFEYVDTSFQPGESSIYTLVSLSAHGVFSRYSAQFEISWDDYHKKIKKKLISRSGSPLSYPNANINQELFKDCIVEEGFDRVFIYFDPSCYLLKGKKIEGFEQVSNIDDLQTMNTENYQSSLQGRLPYSFRPRMNWESTDNVETVYRTVSVQQKADDYQKYIFNFLNVTLQEQEKYELKIIEKRY